MIESREGIPRSASAVKAASVCESSRQYAKTSASCQSAANRNSDSPLMKSAGGDLLICREINQSLRPFSFVPSGFMVVSAVHDAAKTTIMYVA